MKFLVLIIIISFFTISCGEESDIALNASINIDKALDDILTGGEIKIKVYKTDSLMCNELTADCNADLDLTSFTPIEKTIPYDTRNSQNNNINIKPGFYVVTAVGIVGEEEKTNTACSCPFRAENKNYNLGVGDKGEVFLELFEKETK